MYRLYPRLLEELTLELSLAILNKQPTEGHYERIANEIRRDQCLFQTTLDAILRESRKTNERLLMELEWALHGDQVLSIGEAYRRWREADSGLRAAVHDGFSAIVFASSKAPPVPYRTKESRGDL